MYESKHSYRQLFSWTFWIKTEDYDDIKIALKEILDELKDMTTINVDGIENSLEFYLGGDLKFIAIVLGKEYYY